MSESQAADEGVVLSFEKMSVRRLVIHEMEKTLRIEIRKLEIVAGTITSCQNAPAMETGLTPEVFSKHGEKPLAAARESDSTHPDVLVGSSRATAKYAYSYTAIPIEIPTHKMTEAFRWHARESQGETFSFSESEHMEPLKESLTSDLKVVSYFSRTPLWEKCRDPLWRIEEPFRERDEFTVR